MTASRAKVAEQCADLHRRSAEGAAVACQRARSGNRGRGLALERRLRPSRGGGLPSAPAPGHYLGIGKLQVAADHRHDCSLNAAEVEGVHLHYKHRPSVSGLRAARLRAARLGAARLGEISPPDLSPLNLVHLYQETFSRDLSWARCHAESTFAGRREYTAFRRSVTVLPACRFRNSEIAVAYN